MWKFIKAVFWIFCLVEVFAVNIYFRNIWPKKFNEAVNDKCEVVIKQNSECYNEVFTAQKEAQDYKERIKELQNATIKDGLRTYDPPKVCPKPKVIYIERPSEPNNENFNPEDPNDVVPDDEDEK